MEATFELDSTTAELSNPRNVLYTLRYFVPGRVVFI